MITKIRQRLLAQQARDDLRRMIRTADPRVRAELLAAAQRTAEPPRLAVYRWYLSSLPLVAGSR